MNRMLLKFFSALSLFLFVVVNAHVTVNNFTTYAVWLYLNRSSGTDIKVKLAPGNSYTTSVDNVTDVTTLPFDNSMSLFQYEVMMARVLDFPKNLVKTLLEVAATQGYQVDVLNGQNEFSFDRDPHGYFYVYTGHYRVTDPIEILFTSDLHTTPQNIVNNPSSDAKKRLMLQYIADHNKNVQAVILAGDDAGQYGRKSELNAFKSYWYNPLMAALKAKGSNLYICLGNHDTYWNAEHAGHIENLFISEPYPTKTMRFLKDRYDEYLYSYNIGMIKCINLGLHPSAGKVHGVTAKIPDAAQSINYLISQLQTMRKDQPIIIVFHYPPIGNMGDWWSKAEKNKFYAAIKGYNVIAIICGHAHSAALFSFRGDPLIRAGGPEFGELLFNPAQPTRATFYFVRPDGYRYIPQVNPDHYEPDLNPNNA